MKTARLWNIWIPTFAILAGLLIGAFIMVIFGYNPVDNYLSMFQGAFGDINSWGATLSDMTPLIFTALGFSIADSAGFFNIGSPGQALVGWLAAVWFALANSSLPGWLLIPGALLMGGVAGALLSGLAGVLRAYFGTNEVISTIMLNYVALYVVNYLVQTQLAIHHNDYSKTIPAAARLRTPFLEQLTRNSTFSYGFFMALAAAIIIFIVMRFSRIGFEIRAVGLNPTGAAYLGINSKAVIIRSMALSGFLSGLGGAINGLGNYENITVSSALPTIGFNGMAVSLLAGGNPLGILPAALLFSGLSIGGLNMSVVSNTPPEIVNVIIPTIIFFVGCNYAIRYLLNHQIWRKRAADHPAEAAQTTTFKREVD
ncbi:ABC transporter permease [Levilactobacillus bambusae]|uniref:ABC transporter permease n=1 Tax=Levilactobacillus bambusae TaxID=2024736 RepID=A0A2V1MZK1_9LACO|nr:ABC transporter permease [Levilactobacillus bambusae]PWG00407.1 ABC transporter permease [Levilactobacillus bambusae]